MVDLNFIKNEVIGNDTFFTSPYGPRLITYADYTATGRTLRFIEDYLKSIQRFYANTHTDDNFTGSMMNQLINQAEKLIKQSLGANQNNYLIPIGTGSTGAITKLCEILGLYLTPGLKYAIDQHLKDNDREELALLKDLFVKMSKKKPVIYIGPYEHHSNYLIWHECLVDVVEIKLTDQGEMDLDDLRDQMSLPVYQDRLKIGSFSAASNITGIQSDVYAIAKIVHEHQGLVFFDFAASGPYVKIKMNQDEDNYFDAIFLSPHKFIGGPGSCGILVIHKSLYSSFYAPTVAGGGTVSYVSPSFYDFTDDVEMREKAGTPGILQILKAALALELKDKIGVQNIESIEQYYLNKAFHRLANHPNLLILGPRDFKKRIGIFSFNIKSNHKWLHHKFVAKLLNDLFGIQSRAGCACAGPYGHRLLHIDNQVANKIRKAVNAGYHSLKPGFVRVNFHYLMDEIDVDFIMKAIEFIANYGHLFLNQYKINLETGTWTHIEAKEEHTIPFGIEHCLNSAFKEVHTTKIDKQNLYRDYFAQAFKNIRLPTSSFYQTFPQMELEELRWFHFIHKCL